MGITKLDGGFPPAYFGEFKGFASTGESYKKPNSYAVSLKNGELTEEGKIVKARGYRKLSGVSTAWNDNRIREILQFRRSGVDVLLCFGSNAAGTSGGIASVSAQWTSGLAITEVLTLSNITTEAILLQIKDLAYVFNGTDDKWYDGTTWRSIGGSAPTGTITLSTTIAGSMNTSSDYYVARCWYDSTNKRRTNLSPVSAVMTTGGGAGTAGLRVSLPTETPPSGYDKQEIYCTLAFGTQFYLDQTIDYSTTTADITQSDTARAANFIYEGNDDAPSRKYDVGAFVDGKFFGGRTDDATCRVDNTKVSDQYGSMPQSFPPLYFTDCDPNGSDKLVGIGACGPQERETVIVCKQRSFGKLVPITPTRYIYQKIADVGCHGQKSIFRFGTFCGWVNESNVILTDGTSYREIGGGEDGQAIAKTLRSLSQSYKTRVYSCHVQRNKQIRISAVNNGQVYPDIVFMGHTDKLDSEGIVKWTTREKGPSAATHPGVQACCIKVVLDDQNNERVIFGNSAGNGLIYEWDYGTSDDGYGIWSNWEFRPEAFGIPEDEKLFGDIHARVRTGDSSTSILFGIKKNLAGSMEVLAQKTVGGSGFALGSGRFGITSFTNSPIGHLTIPCQERAEEAAVVVRETTTKTMELLDFTMTGSP